MTRVLLLCIVLMSGLASFIILSNIDGKWKGNMQGFDGDMEIVFDFKTNADTLTGVVEGPMGEMPIINGKISGDEFSFDISFNGMSMNHQCKIAGDSIFMKIPGMPDGDAEMILTRVDEKK